MHLEYPPRETIRERLERDRSAINTLLADPALDDLVLQDRLPNGDHAWRRIQPEEGGDALVDTGSRDLEMTSSFDHGPTVADDTGSRPARCIACGQYTA